MSERALLSGVRYVLADTLPKRERESVRVPLMQMEHVLEQNGATAASSIEDRAAFEANATHLITESHCAQTRWCQPLADAQAMRNPQHPCAVTVRGILMQPLWVTRSVALQHIQPEGLYSPDPSRFFSGIVVSCAGMSPHDQEMISVAVESLGGAVKQTLCEEVTHLVATTRDASKVRALEERPDIHIQVVAPHWINESFRLNRRLPLRDYVFDLQKPNALPVCLCASWDRPSEIASSPAPSQSEEGASVLAGKKVLFARDLHGGALESHPELHSLRDRVQSAGGLCLDTLDAHASDDMLQSSVRTADVVVARFRESPEFGAAMRQYTTVGTLPWLVHVLAKGRMISPRDRLLHFPYPSTAVPGFERLTITITNYSGTARTYLKELIAKMGGTFTPHMTPSHDVCVALDLVGEKVAKAREWNIPIVNHIWLEQCFATWTNQNLAQSQYITFPGAAQLKAVVGHASVPDTSLLAWLGPGDEPEALSHSQATPEPNEEAADETHATPPPETHPTDTQPAHTPDTAPAVVDESVYVSERSRGESPAESPVIPRAQDAPEPVVTDAREEPEEARAEVEEAQAEADEAAAEENEEAQTYETPTSAAPAPRAEEAQAAQEEPREPSASTFNKSEPACATPEAPVETPKTPAPNGVGAEPARAAQGAAEPAAVPAASNHTAGGGETSPASQAATHDSPMPDAPEKGVQPSAAPETSLPAAKEQLALSDDQLAEAELGVAPPSKRKSDHSTRPASTRKRKVEVSIATTSVELKPSTLAVLDALHVRRVEDVSEATHLIAKGLTRTEKMLCAIALGTVQIVSVDWLKEIVRRKALVDAEPYALHDAEKEAKWSMKLSQALARSRAHPGALLANHTVYLGKSVQPSKDVLRRVVEAAGGRTAPLSSASVRALMERPEEQYVVASREDRKQLNTLRDQAEKQGHTLPFWTPELILVGVLRQAMHFDAEYALHL